MNEPVAIFKTAIVMLEVKSIGEEGEKRLSRNLHPYEYDSGDRYIR